MKSIPGYITDMNKKMFIVVFCSLKIETTPMSIKLNALWYIHRMEHCTCENKLTTTTQDTDEAHKYNVM